MNRTLSGIGLLGLVALLLSAAILAETTTATAQQISNRGQMNIYSALRQSQAALPCTLRTGAAKTSGRIDLSWSCSSNALKGWFLVERSTGATWQNLTRCRQAVARTSSYSCADTGLTSRASYNYQLCLVSSSTVTRCGTNNRTATVTARAPYREDK